MDYESEEEVDRFLFYKIVYTARMEVAFAVLPLVVGIRCDDVSSIAQVYQIFHGNPKSSPPKLQSFLRQKVVFAEPDTEGINILFSTLVVGGSDFRFYFDEGIFRSFPQKFHDTAQVSVSVGVIPLVIGGLTNSIINNIHDKTSFHSSPVFFHVGNR